MLDSWLAYLYAPILPYLSKIKVKRVGLNLSQRRKAGVALAGGLNCGLRCSFDSAVLEERSLEGRNARTRFLETGCSDSETLEQEARPEDGPHPLLPPHHDLEGDAESGKRHADGNGIPEKPGDHGSEDHPRNHQEHGQDR